MLQLEFSKKQHDKLEIAYKKLQIVYFIESITCSMLLVYTPKKNITRVSFSSSNGKQHLLIARFLMTIA